MAMEETGDGLGERLYDLRTKAGYSQEQLAELLGVSRQAVSRWEVGQGKPEIDNVVKLAQIYRVSVDYVLTGEQHVPSVSEVEARPARRDLPREYRVAVSIVLVFMGLAAAFVLFILLAGIVYTLFWGLPGAA